MSWAPVVRDTSFENFVAWARVHIARWADDLGRERQDILECLLFAFDDPRAPHGDIVRAELQRRKDLDS